MSSIGGHFFSVTAITLLSETFSIGSIFIIKYLAEYLQDEEDDMEKAIILVASFSGCVFMGNMFRNYYIFSGYMLSLELRKLLVAAMFDKVGKLSMRSLTETNSGKLITLVSSDIFTLERPFALAPFFFAAPFLNLACYLIIW